MSMPNLAASGSGRRAAAAVGRARSAASPGRAATTAAHKSQHRRPIDLQGHDASRRTGTAARQHFPPGFSWISLESVIAALFHRSVTLHPPCCGEAGTPRPRHGTAGKAIRAEDAGLPVSQPAAPISRTTMPTRIVTTHYRYKRPPTEAEGGAVGGPGHCQQARAALTAGSHR